MPELIGQAMRSMDGERIQRLRVKGIAISTDPPIPQLLIVLAIETNEHIRLIVDCSLSPIRDLPIGHIQVG